MGARPAPGTARSTVEGTPPRTHSRAPGTTEPRPPRHPAASNAGGGPGPRASAQGHPLPGPWGARSPPGQNQQKHLIKEEPWSPREAATGSGPGLSQRPCVPSLPGTPGQCSEGFREGRGGKQGGPRYLSFPRATGLAASLTRGPRRELWQDTDRTCRRRPHPRPRPRDWTFLCSRLTPPPPGSPAQRAAV